MFGYIGHQYDHDIGIYHNRVRTYTR